MKEYKNFLIRICDIENIKAKELKEITGKSQSVAHSWLNYKSSDFPTIDSLGKILFRLGLSFDDFINCRHPIYDDGKAERVYQQCIHHIYDESYIGRDLYIGSDLLDLPRAEEAIKTYLYDRMQLTKMIDAANGSEIDLDRFNFLCKALRPVIVSDIIPDAKQPAYEINSQTLNDYRLGLAYMREIEEEHDGEPDFAMPEHYIHFPDANYVILLAAEQSPSLLNEYLTVISDREKVCLLDDYLRVRADHPDYDKKNRVIKRLMEEDCRFYDTKANTAGEKYDELMRMVLKIR